MSRRYRSPKRAGKRGRVIFPLAQVVSGVFSTLLGIYLVLFAHQHLYVVNLADPPSVPGLGNKVPDPPARERAGDTSAATGPNIAPQESNMTAPRIIFAVPMPWPLKDDLAKDNLIATISTWGSHAARLVLVVSQQQIERFPPDQQLGERHSQIKDYLHSVPMVRADGLKGGRNIWEKMWRGWKLVADRFRFEAEWFVKADLDTFVAVENMRAFLSFISTQDPYYFGHTLFHDWERHNLVFNSGTCYILSRESLRRLAIRLSRIEPSREFTYQCGDGPGAREDPHTAGCLRDVGIPASDSLDSNGKQRFLTFRPKDHLFAMKVDPGREKTWFWLMKDTSKQLLDCCSNYPISFHNFKSHPRIVYDTEAYYRLEYFLSTRSYEAVRKGIDPPRGMGRPFALTGEPPSPIDDNLNIKTAPSKQHFGHWLKENPDMYACVNKTQECFCELPEQIPHLGDNVVVASVASNPNCMSGGKIGIGEKCLVTCGSDYERLGDEKPRYITCPDGALLYPEPLTCRSKCKVDSVENLKEKVASLGDKVIDTKTGSKISCGNGRALFDGSKVGAVNCKNGQIGAFNQCAPCKKWTLTLKGTSYTHNSWKTVEFDGSADTKFEVVSVATKSKDDPVGNCFKWNQGQQLLLKVKGGKMITPLSCGNQVINIEKTTSEARKCA